jgi:ribosome-binding factor A
MGFRLERLNELFKKEVGQLFLRELDFPPDILVTITKVETRNDLVVTYIFVSVWPLAKWPVVEKILRSNVYHIQKKIDKRLKMKPVPKIIFKKDEGQIKAARVAEILNQINKEEL